MSQAVSSSANSTPKLSNNFTFIGIITFGVVLWVTSQNASGEIRKLTNGFLGVLLLSMILLNWKNIGPIFFKTGG